jgi:epoxyqueuosine reductase
MKDEIRERAHSLGFGDVGFASAEPFATWQKQKEDLCGEMRPAGIDRLDSDPGKLMEGARCIVVCLLPFAMNSAMPDEVAPFASYYLHSQRAHGMIKKLASFISSTGHKAEADPPLPARHAALRAFGGVYGDNTLFVHEKFGSLCAIRLVLTDACEPDPPRSAAIKCPKCGKCAQACPAGAITEEGFLAQRCLRASMGRGRVPEEQRGLVATLLGCEMCSRACPLNSEIREELPPEEVQRAFRYENILSGRSMDALGDLIGRNLIDEGRLQAVTALVAANSGREEIAPLLEELLGDSREWVSEQAGWALEKLKRSGRSSSD